MKNKKGFTLAELLIVVAVIIVLVSISIPIFTKQSEKSREAVDISNMRNALSLASASYLNEDVIDGKDINSYSSSNPLYYDGSSKLTSSMPEAYGKGTSSNGNTSYAPCSDFSYDSSQDYTSSIIMVWIQNDTIHVHWNQTSPSNNQSPVHSPLSSSKYWTDGFNFDVAQGDIIEYNGQQYVALVDGHYEDDPSYDTDTPDNEFNGVFAPLSSNPIIYDSSHFVIDGYNPAHLENIERGALFKDDDGNYYICQWGTGWSNPPTGSDSTWTKINQ